MSLTLSQEAISYMKGEWGLDTTGTTAEEDTGVLLWENGYCEETAKYLVDAGAVEPICPEAEEMIKVAESITDDEYHDTVISLQEKLEGQDA